MIVDWSHAWPAAAAAFLASLVEFVEALTIVLAVGAVRGWRGALTGTGAALLVLLREYRWTSCSCWWGCCCFSSA